MPLVEIKDLNALFNNKPFVGSASKKQKKSVWKTYWNVKKWWLHNSKFIGLFVSSILL